MPIQPTNIETFEQSVINASYEKPIAVAFEVSSILERIAEQLKFTIAKLDSQDPNNQQLVGYLQLRGIEDIRIFKDGQIAGGVSGLLPEGELKKELAQFFVSEEELLLIGAEEALNLGQTASALKTLQKLAAKNPANQKAVYLLAKAQTLAGKKDDARATIQSIKSNSDFYNESQSLLYLMELDKETCKLIVTNKHRDALNKFLTKIENNQDGDGTAKKAMIAIFSVLGTKSELAWEYRAKLNRAIYV